MGSWGGGEERASVGACVRGACEKRTAVDTASRRSNSVEITYW